MQEIMIEPNAMNAWVYTSVNLQLERCVLMLQDTTIVSWDEYMEYPRCNYIMKATAGIQKIADTVIWEKCGMLSQETTMQSWSGTSTWSTPSEGIS